MSDDRIERLRRDIVAERAELDRLHMEADRQGNMFADLAWKIPAAFVVGVCIGAVLWLFGVYP
jgi:hypothetical protein